MKEESNRTTETETKKAYRTPQLTVHGTLTELTRGESQVQTDGFFTGGTENNSHS